MNKVESLAKILVAIDGSEISMRAAEYGIEFAKKYNAKLIILHVIHIHAAGLMYTTESTFKQLSFSMSKKLSYPVHITHELIDNLMTCKSSASTSYTMMYC